MKLKKNNWVWSSFVRSVLILYPISPPRRRENKTRTFWSPEPISSGWRLQYFVCGDTREMFGNVWETSALFIQTFQTFVCSNTSKVIEIQVRLVNWGDGLQKQFWMLRDFRENWQFRLSQFCLAIDSNFHFKVAKCQKYLCKLFENQWWVISVGLSYLFNNWNCLLHGANMNLLRLHYSC